MVGIVEVEKEFRQPSIHPMVITIETSIEL